MIYKLKFRPNNLRIFIDDRAFDPKSKNNWVLIRLCAALAVIYGHSFGMFEMPGHQDITVRWLTKGITYSGQIAVIIFFFLSGALVTGSLLNSNPIAFLIKRISRLLPGLAFCLVISAFATFVVFPNILFEDILKYICANLLNTFNVGQFPSIGGSVLWEIPGTFDGHKYKALNGSLWTLPQEFRLYFFIFLISMISSKLTKRRFLGINFLILFLLLRAPITVPWIGSSDGLLGNQDAVINSIFFLIGSCFYMLEIDRLKSGMHLVISILLYMLWLSFKETHLLFFAAVVFFTLFTAKVAKLYFLKLPGDYSYGVYLYGWPAGQFLYAISPNLNPEAAFVYTSLLALLFAIPSWHFVEKRTLNSVKRQLSSFASKNNV